MPISSIYNSEYSMLNQLQAKTAAEEKANQAAAKEDDKASELEKAAEVKKDGFQKSGTTQVTYKKNQLTRKDIDQLMADAEQRYKGLQEMLRSMISTQGQKSNLVLFGQKLTVTPQQSAEAAKAIGEGGEYSVDAVATRIMDMAKGLAGGDASKISLLRNAVEKGFKAAGVDFGGKLPDISNQTHDEVMKRFDDWEKESQNKEGETSVKE